MTAHSISRRYFVKAFGLGVAATAIPSCSFFGPVSTGNQPDRRPNVLLIMTDDQGWGDLHSHGNDKIDTPVLDKLGTEGARFDRFFVSPVCAPTRAGLLTGRYHLRTGTHGVTRGRENMRADEVTIAEVFKAADYSTGCFGKWHNGSNWPYHPNAQGFDEFVGFCAGHWNNYFDTHLEHNGTPIKTTGYITDVLTDFAISFIQKNKHRPFFCYLPYNAPHSPFQVPDEYFDKYKARGLNDPLACVYGMCENLDDNIGRLLKSLDYMKLTQNTIVIFLTDNGPQTDRYNSGMKGRKGSVHEGGIRVPCFFRWPDQIEAGVTIEQIASNIDLLPTIVDLCGVKMPKTLPLDGISVAPLLTGKTAKWPDRMIFTFRPRGRAVSNAPGSVRTRRWRAVTNSGKWELYDMVEDPAQKKNVAENYPNVTGKLRAAYDKIYPDVAKDGFDLPIHVGYPQWPLVVLPGHEAHLKKYLGGGISYVGNYGWANDWITNWTDIRAYAWWDVKVVDSGRFEITLMYICKAGDIGAKVRVEIGDQKADGIVTHAHDPEPVYSPDRVPREEAFEKVWAPLKLGTVDLKPGPTKLVVRALTRPGEMVLDLKAIHLKRIG